MNRIGLLACLLFVQQVAVAAEPPPCHKAVDESVRHKTLTAFASEDELNALLKCFRDDFQRRQDEARKQNEKRMKAMAAPGMAATTASPPPPPAPAAAPAKSEAKAKGADSESVTNTQTAGVDEGGIVKVHGDHLVILRRGRLFTVGIDKQQLKPLSVLDAFAPDADPRGAWYDEMLISGNTIVVVGYSYARGGTEIGLFDIDAGGRLAYRATYHLRSGDYYSARNYASRLIGNKLIFYTPLQLNFWHGDPFATFPAVRRWNKGVQPADFKRIAPATRIYRTDDPLDPYTGLALHTVNICDLGKAEMTCEATAVMGPPGRVFYVSAGSVYVWTTVYTYNREQTMRSAVFRIPLDGSAPSALKTAGAPVDQFSFLESDDDHLNVLVRSRGRGDGMWSSEATSGETALLRVRLDRFSDGRDAAPAEAYQRLPNPGGYTVQNRYVGDYLLYGSGNAWRYTPETEGRNLYAVRWAKNAPAQVVPLAHSVDRIEAMGGHALAVGTLGKDLLFSSVELGAQQALFGHLYTRKNAAQGETRSHGFFYKPQSADTGLIGIPITGAGRPGYKQLNEESAAVLFLRNQALRLNELGALDARPGAGTNDGCRASCVDWYGNSRPLFLRGRVFALMGYELVEGRVTAQGISEIRRISFAPQAPTEIAR